MEQLIEQGLQDLGIESSTEQLECLGLFLKSLSEFARAIHLVSRSRDPVMEGLKQVLDSVALLRLPLPEEGKVLDAGSGVGIPAIPLGCLRPGWKITLLDRSDKRTTIAGLIIKRLGLGNISVIKSVFPDAVKDVQWDMAMCKAFLPFNEWVGAAGRLVRPGGLVVAMKGRVKEDIVRFNGMQLLHRDHFRLPIFDVPRENLVFVREG